MTLSDMSYFVFSDSQLDSNKPLVVVEEEPQGEEDLTQTNTEEDTSCKSNSTIEPVAEPTDSTATDDKPNLTGNTEDQLENDPAAAAQTESEVDHWLACVLTIKYVYRPLSQLLVWFLFHQIPTLLV